MYGCKPVLQCIPYLVITYPNVSHEKFIPKQHNFPANWHTDYQSEFSIHLPIVEINSSNTHTMYAAKTHVSFLKAPKKESQIKDILRSYAKNQMQLC